MDMKNVDKVVAAGFAGLFSLYVKGWVENYIRNMRMSNTVSSYVVPEVVDKLSWPAAILAVRILSGVMPGKYEFSTNMGGFLGLIAAVLSGGSGESEEKKKELAGLGQGQTIEYIDSQGTVIFPR